MFCGGFWTSFVGSLSEEYEEGNWLLERIGVSWCDFLAKSGATRLDAVGRNGGSSPTISVNIFFIFFLSPDCANVVIVFGTVLLALPVLAACLTFC